MSDPWKDIRMRLPKPEHVLVGSSEGLVEGKLVRRLLVDADALLRWRDFVDDELAALAHGAQESGMEVVAAAVESSRTAIRLALPEYLRRAEPKGGVS